MRRLAHLRWFLNGALVGLCVFFCARIATAVLDAFERQEPAVGAAEAAPAAPAPPPRSWNDRRVIVTRNLFDASLVEAPEPPPPPPREEVEETELPLGLLGTISSPGSERGWAAIWNAESRTSRVVEPGDQLGDGAATVVRIERERVLLSEDGTLSELVLEEDGQYRPPKKKFSKRLRAMARRGSRRPRR